MEEFYPESLNAPKVRADRFVLPRSSLLERSRRIAWDAHTQRVDGEIWSSKYLQQKRFTNFLDEAFNLPPLKAPRTRVVDEWSWPCVPRKKSYLSSADSVLDLPMYSLAIFPQLVDWSNSGILVAALGSNYHKWSWRTQSTISRGITYFNIVCCRFDPRGELLLLGTIQKTVEVHNNELNKFQYVILCKCSNMCAITVIDWSPTGNSFVMGCTYGTICSVRRRGHPKKRVIEWNPVFNGATLTARISPNARFVAAAGYQGNAAVVLSWPDLKLYNFLPTFEIIKDLTWHPWRSALLGIGMVDGLHSKIAMWEPASDRHRIERVGRGAYSIDSMLFNRRTGELVLSLSNIGRTETMPGSSQLVVMSDFDNVVDHWGEGRPRLDRTKIRTMVFSPDGTKLATATSEEDLIIWNFLPKDYKKKKSCKNFSAFPQFLDTVAYGVTLR